MGLETKILKQTAIYWALASDESGGIDFDDEGQPSFASPVEINCRWEERTEEIVLNDGTVYQSQAKVFVDRDLDVSGFLKFGELVSGLDMTVPKNNEKTWEIRRFDEIRDLKCRRLVRIAYL
jgi:hypothetical protein